MTDPTGRVFDALADPNRRYVLEALAERETATATELGVAMDWMASVGADWDARLAALRKHLRNRRP